MTQASLEIANNEVPACLELSVNVVQLHLKDCLMLFDNQRFDAVLQLQTPQQLRNTTCLQRETVRVGRPSVASCPEFACPLAEPAEIGPGPPGGAPRAALLGFTHASCGVLDADLLTAQDDFTGLMPRCARVRS